MAKELEVELRNKTEGYLKDPSTSTTYPDPDPDNEFDMLSTKDSANLLKRQAAYKEDEFEKCSRSKLIKPSLNKGDALEEMDNGCTYKDGPNCTSKTPYIYNYNTIKPSRNRHRHYVTTARSSLKEKQGTSIDDKRDQTSDTLMDFSQQSKPRVTFQETARFSSPRTECGGWREASIRHANRNNKCKLLCRPAKGISDIYEIVLPTYLDDDVSQDNMVCNMVSCQCPLRLSTISQGTSKPGAGPSETNNVGSIAQDRSQHMFTNDTVYSNMATHVTGHPNVLTIDTDHSDIATEDIGFHNMPNQNSGNSNMSTHYPVRLDMPTQGVCHFKLATSFPNKYSKATVESSISSQGSSQSNVSIQGSGQLNIPSQGPSEPDTPRQGSGQHTMSTQGSGPPNMPSSDPIQLNISNPGSHQPNSMSSQGFIHPNNVCQGVDPPNMSSQAFSQTTISSQGPGQPNMSNNYAKKSQSGGHRPLTEPLSFAGRVVHVEGDGRCLFRSLSVCVAPLLQSAKRNEYGVPIREKYADTETQSADKLRSLLVRHMQKDAHTYEAMDSHVLNADQIKKRFSTFADRLAAMTKPRTHAGEMEINAVAKVIRRPVLVLNSNLEYINVYGAERFPHARACALRFTKLAQDVGHYDAVILKHDVTGQDIVRNNVMLQTAAVAARGSAKVQRTEIAPPHRRTSPEAPALRRRSPMIVANAAPLRRSPRLVAKAERQFNRNPCEMGIGECRKCRRLSLPPRARTVPPRVTASRVTRLSAGQFKCALCHKVSTLRLRMPTCCACGNEAHTVCAKKHWSYWSDYSGVEKFICKNCVD